MSIFSRLSRAVKAFRGISLADFDKYLDHQVSGQSTQTGVTITNDSAMAYSAVFNAVEVIAGSVASLPCILYKRLNNGGREPATNHPLFGVLRNLPNFEMTSYVWREISMSHLLLWGNSYSEIKKDGMGRVISLWPLNPQKITVKRNDNKKIIYILDEGDGKKRTLRAEQVLHIPGLGFDGRIGYSVLTLAREAMGLGLGMETFQSRFYGAGTNLGSIFEHPGKLSQQAHDNLRKDLTEKYAGLAQSQKAIILEEGMKYQKVGMPLNDAQFLESRTFQVVEIARWFNLPPHKLKELSKATFSNIEQQQIEFVQDTIRPWLIRWEQHISWKLLDEGERKRLFAEFMLDALLRGDMESRNQALSTQRMNGAINANEWRALINMNPIKGRAGDIYWQPLNMTDAGEPDTIAADQEPPEPDEEEENSLTPKEQRQRRTVQSRRRVALAYKSVFMSAVQRILAKETKAIRRLAKKNFSERQLGEFVFDINQYYKTFRNTISKEIGGVYDQYGSAIYPMAADEINADIEPTAEYTAYVGEFTETTTKRYVSSSVAQLTELAKEEDALAAIEERLDHWEQTRAEQIASREIVDGEAGLAQFVYYSFGFRAVWVAFGKSCPYCSSLDGMIISRGMNFLSEGQAFQPEGADSPLVVSGNVSHPGAHAGCDCSIMAGI